MSFTCPIAEKSCRCSTESSEWFTCNSFIVGDHDVIFAGEDEVITFSHTAYSKAVFGKGAVQAAKFLAGKSAGLYNMQDVIEG